MAAWLRAPPSARFGSASAQSLNQVAKAYGENNSIVDNCHIRATLGANDERTARRISDSLGTATEMRAMKNYAGHRLSPWLGHLMVSRQETARPLMTPGEILQMPAHEAIIQMAGLPPIRARKVRYYMDARLSKRVLPPPEPGSIASDGPPPWGQVVGVSAAAGEGRRSVEDEGGHRIEPEFEAPAEPVREAPEPEAWLDPDPDADESAQAEQSRRFRLAARQASLDPDDGIPL